MLAAVGICIPVVWIVVGMATPLVPTLSRSLCERTSVSADTSLSIVWTSMLLLQGLSVLAHVHLLEHKPRSSIGLRRLSRRDIGNALLVSLIEFSLSGRISGLHFASWTGIIVSGPAIDRLPWTVCVAFLTADAFAEELWCRGYVIERVLTISGRAWVAAVVSPIASLAIHVPAHGIYGALYLAPMMLLLTVLYLWRRSSSCCILAHFLIDAELLVLLRLPPRLRSRALRLLGFPH